MSDRLTRRAAIGAIASIPAIGGAAALPMSAPDPLVEAIARYRRKLAEFAAVPDDVDDDDAIEAEFSPPYDALAFDTPSTTSMRGVMEAIRFCLSNDEVHLASDAAEGVLISALKYLEGEYGL
ncbi:hypothetical protein [Mesorhizobium sp. WSM3876]|uniref:hypothetical protein n=1 Tax=Mesorhizobium sp. WSM3876 TaxID=422277 RepID=UPI000BD54232|nr:hypothetical protein [Mesorhizobium sp. WSM3876]PBB83581.1 hypothetical protein CK216_27890 [Mesorhizobium sp. WSM3876]